MALPVIKTEHQIGITIIILLAIDVWLQFLMLRAIQQQGNK